MRTARAGPLLAAFPELLRGIVDERPPHRFRRPRARAGLGAVGEPAARQALLRAGQCRHRRGRRTAWPSMWPTTRLSSASAGTTRSTSWWSAPRRRWWRASPTISPRPGSRCSAPPRRRPNSRAPRASPRTCAASSPSPRAPTAASPMRAPPRPTWRRRSCPSSSRPTAWRPARAWSIAETAASAEAAVEACFAGAFGAAGAEVVIEEFLEGEEASFFALVDGEHVLPLADGAGPQARRRRRYRPQHRRHGRLFAGARDDARDDAPDAWTRSSGRPCAAWPRAARRSRACSISAS